MKKSTILLGALCLTLMVTCSPKNPETKASKETVEYNDYGPEPFVFNIEDYTLENDNFRTTIWTGKTMQMTLMTLKPGEDIGLELHDDIDQFIRVEEGSGMVMMGDTEDNLNFKKRVSDDFAVFIPAGKWHNLVNDSNKPLKLYSIYAPVEHPRGTVHATREEGLEAHDH